jgi:hypothetical protein
MEGVMDFHAALWISMRRDGKVLEFFKIPIYCVEKCVE